METCLVYVTAGSADEAEKIATALVEERLAACANILGPITSIFRWEGALQHQNEVALLLKSQPHLTKKLTERVTQLHTYDCPCVIALPITGGNPEFLKWIAEETSYQVDNK